MSIKIRWYKIDEDNKILWRVNRGIYAYLSPYGEILYIGKVNGTTVRKRFQRSAKSRYWDFVENDLGHFETEVMVGIIEFPEGSRHSRQKLSDIESLLINKIQPSGNIACRSTRISRPGLTVTCCGNWHYTRKKFVDS